jgi:hypothetical protein
MATHRVYYGKGEQPLITVPHRGGRPVRLASATYAICDLRHGDTAVEYVVVAAGEAATIDTTSTTLTAKAGRTAETRRRLALTSTADLVEGHSYLLQAATGEAELVTIASVASGTIALAAAEIRGDYPAASTLRGVEVTATFPAEPAADVDNLDGMPWLLVWDFGEGWSPIRETVHLERGEEAQLATLADLLRLDPFLSVQGGDRVDPATALDRAHRDFRTDLLLAGANESDLLAGPIGRDAVLYRAAQLCLHHSEADADRAKAESYGARYQELRTALQVGAKKPKVTVLDHEDASARPTNTAGLFRMFGAAQPKGF